MNHRTISDTIFWLGVSFVLLCLIHALSGCGEDMNHSPICRHDEGRVGRVEAPIIDGVPSQDRRGSALVFLPRGYCTGTVIGPHTVLTAGHCKNPESIEIDIDGQRIGFEAIANFAHPDYNGNLRNDVRLVFVGDVLPEPYVTIASEPIECENLVAQGYGIGSEGALHERFVYTVVRYDEVIIGTESICNGDSGGGLYALHADGSYSLVGVNSFGFGEAGVCDGPVGFANLLVLGDWVVENIN
jgi:hypothetical protein